MDMLHRVKFESWKPVFWRLPGAQALKRGRRLLVILPTAALVGLLIQRFLICFVVVRGQSMAPNFSEGQYCFVHKATGAVARGDVVIVQDGHGQTIKRVVGLPNESLLFRQGKVYVDGRELPEPYLRQPASTWPVWQTRFTLDSDHIFVMGDNRGQSEDSRVYGPLQRNSILGKVAL